jgi:hypothetical protein
MRNRNEIQNEEVINLAESHKILTELLLDLRDLLTEIKEAKPKLTDY